MVYEGLVLNSVFSYEDVLSQLDELILVLKAAGVLFTFYIVFMLVRWILSLRKSWKIEKIDKKLEVIEEKVDKIDNNLKKVLKK